MARWATGSFVGASTASTHSLGLAPKVALGLSGGAASTADDTTQASVGAVSVGYARSTLTTGQHVVAYDAFFGGSSAQMNSTARESNLWAGGTSVGITFSSVIGLTSASVNRTLAAFPAAYMVLGGDDVSAAPSSAVAVSTVASTQASTGYGFTPNAAIVLGQSFASSVANFSFGFACVDTTGTRSQWSISQTGREHSAANVHRSASTGSALKLHTTATTAHDVSVTSFRSDGLELTVNATDTARAATVSILGLSVPKADAGKATISTAGVASVTGISQNIGLVILASIGTSLQTLQEHNCFSIGFASSNGNQRSVAGSVQNGGGAANRYGSYFNSTRAVTFLAVSSNAGTGPFAGSSVAAGVPSKVAQGLFAIDTATSGFTVTFDTTGVAGVDLYWAALSNVVTDIGGSIQGSLSASAGLNFLLNLGGSVQGDLQAMLGMTPEFIPSEGKVRANAELKLFVEQALSVGLGRGATEETDDRFLVVQENSSSPDITKTLDITTQRQRLGVAEFGNAAFLAVEPPGTNTHPLRIAASLTAVGMPLSSRGMSVFSLADRAGTDVYLYTTESTTIEGVRTLLR